MVGLSLVVGIVAYFVFVMALGWYMITNLQWYNYKLDRVVFKHHKWQWHILYFVAPILLYCLFPYLDSLGILFINIVFAVIYVPLLFFWHKKLDKKLVLTSRVKRFFAILFVILCLLFLYSFLTIEYMQLPSVVYVLLPLVLTYIITTLLEKMFFLSFKNKGKKRVQSIKNLQIVAITASYGKTSIKNYLYHVLNSAYVTYKTPRSVNTIGGIVLDVNRDLPDNTQVYIAEAGARQTGDIEEIAKFLQPQVCVIGSVGEQHIEYFKTLDNIKKTKCELLKSPQLRKAFVHNSVGLENSDKIEVFPKGLKVLKSTLDGIEFEFEIQGQIHKFSAPLLGSFNAINLSAVVLVAHHLSLDIKDIQKSLQTLPQVEHRLQKIQAGGKIIIDDSFNGNLEGMLEAVNICSTHTGRKVIITPGLVESTNEANTTLAKAINEKFDLVIITGSLNAEILSANIDKDKIFMLKDKSQMQDILATKTKAGDLILFANDAPNFI